MILLIVVTLSSWRGGLPHWWGSRQPHWPGDRRRHLCEHLDLFSFFLNIFFIIILILSEHHRHDDLCGQRHLLYNHKIASIRWICLLIILSRQSHQYHVHDCHDDQDDSWMTMMAPQPREDRQQGSLEGWEGKLARPSRGIFSLEL